MTALTVTMADLPAHQGRELGPSDWVEITQNRVNLFAGATADHQWIHVAIDRAQKESPYGGPIGHGYLTLSLLVPMLGSLLHISDSAMGVNYGLNKVRFPAPVPVGARIRLTATLDDVSEVTGGLQVVMTARVEREGADKPVCVAEPVVRYYRAG